MGNELLEIDENTINEFICLENVGIGTKIIILALFGLEKIDDFAHFGVFLSPFWPPRPKILGKKLLDVAENTITEFLGMENVCSICSVVVLYCLMYFHHQRIIVDLLQLADFPKSLCTRGLESFSSKTMYIFGFSTQK